MPIDGRQSPIAPSQRRALIQMASMTRRALSAGRYAGILSNIVKPTNARIPLSTTKEESGKRSGGQTGQQGLLVPLRRRRYSTNQTGEGFRSGLRISHHQARCSGLHLKDSIMYETMAIQLGACGHWQLCGHLQLN
jgi:hypothetical protein